MKKKLRCCLVFAFPPIIFVLIVAIYFLVRNQNTALSHSTCDLPCWNGIIPGKTSKEEALAIVNALSFIDKKSIYITKEAPAYFQEMVDFNLYPDVTGYLPSARASIYFYMDRVARITLVGNVGLRLGQIIEKFGEPAFVFSDMYGEKNPYLLAFYPSLGIVVDDKLDRIKAQITPNDPIDMLSLVDPDLFQEVLDDGGIFQVPKSPEIRTYPWKGYGTILEKYWPSTNSINYKRMRMSLSSFVHCRVEVQSAESVGTHLCTFIELVGTNLS